MRLQCADHRAPDPTMQRYYFSLDIPASEYLHYYSGAAARVLVRAQDGRTLSLPAVNLRRFVSSAGIHGDFCLTVDDDQRFVSLERQDRATPGVRA